MAPFLANCNDLSYNLLPGAFVFAVGAGIPTGKVGPIFSGQLDSLCCIREINIDVSLNPIDPLAAIIPPGSYGIFDVYIRLFNISNYIYISALLNAKVSGTAGIWQWGPEDFCYDLYCLGFQMAFNKNNVTYSAGINYIESFNIFQGTIPPSRNQTKYNATKQSYMSCLENGTRKINFTKNTVKQDNVIAAYCKVTLPDISLPIYTIELDTYFTPYTDGFLSSPPQWYLDLSGSVPPTPPSTGLSGYPWYHFLPPLANNFTEYVNQPFVLQIKVSDPAYVFSPGSAGTDERILLYGLFNGTNFGVHLPLPQPYWDNHVNQINNIKAVYFDDSMLGTTSPTFNDGLTVYFTDIVNNEQIFRWSGGENLRVIRLPAGLNPSDEVFPRPHGVYTEGGQTQFFRNERIGNLKFLFYGSRIFINTSVGVQGNRGGNGSPQNQTWDDEDWGENREDGGTMKDFTVNQIASANALLNLPYNATDAEITAAENAIS